MRPRAPLLRARSETNRNVGITSVSRRYYVGAGSVPFRPGIERAVASQVLFKSQEFESKGSVFCLNRLDGDAHIRPSLPFIEPDRAMVLDDT